MKLHITGQAVSPLVKLAVAARVVYGVIIDMPELHNAGWLTIPLGGLLALPLALSATYLRRQSAASPADTINQSAPKIFRLLAVLLFIVAAFDAAFIAAGLAGSASYAALNNAPVAYLMIPQFLLCLLCLRTNGDAIGASAGIWNRILPCLLLIIVLLESRDYRPAWLTPILGPGIPKLLDGAVRTAGWLSLPIGLYLIAVPSKDSPCAPLKCLFTSVLAATLLCLMHSMMTPTRLNNQPLSRFYLMDALLANGRTVLSLQLPTLILWFISLFYTLLFDTFTCAIMLQTALPQLEQRACSWITMIVIVLMAMSRYTSRDYGLSAASFMYVILGGILAVAMLLAMKTKGGKARA